MLWARFSFISFGNFDLWVVQIVFPNFVGPERHQVSDHDELVVCPVRLRQVFDLGVVAAQLAVHRGAIVAQKNPAVHFSDLTIHRGRHSESQSYPNPEMIRS